MYYVLKFILKLIYYCFIISIFKNIYSLKMLLM